MAQRTGSRGWQRGALLTVSVRTRAILVLGAIVLASCFFNWWAWSFSEGGGGAESALQAHGYPIEVLARVVVLAVALVLAAAGIEVLRGGGRSITTQALATVLVLLILVSVLVGPRDVGASVRTSPGAIVAIGAAILLLAATFLPDATSPSRPRRS